MIPSPMTWLTVPSYRWTASIIRSRTGSRSFRASSGSRSASSSIDPLRSANEHRDLFALAFEGAPGGEDLLGEVLRSVGLRGLEARFGSFREWCGALSTEFIAGRIGRTA